MDRLGDGIGQELLRDPSALPGIEITLEEVDRGVRDFRGGLSAVDRRESPGRGIATGVLATG